LDLQYLVCKLIGSLLRANSSKASFEVEMNNFKRRMTERGYPINFVENVLSVVKQEGRIIIIILIYLLSFIFTKKNFKEK